MLTRRIVPCLDVHDGRVTRGEQFGRAEAGELNDVGDPVELARRYDAQGADELVIYDITATAHGRQAVVGVIQQVATECFMPLTVGGGVRTLDDFRELFEAGADKVSINSGAVTNPSLLQEASVAYGAQAVVLSIDAKRRDTTGWDVYVAGGRKNTGLDATKWAAEGERLGAGEIVINSIDADGMKTGFDLPLVRAITGVVGIPVVASGGAGNPAHMAELLAGTEADAALAAGIFHRGEATVDDVKAAAKAAGVQIRPRFGEEAA